jgi:hypothetical protein
MVSAVSPIPEAVSGARNEALGNLARLAELPCAQLLDFDHERPRKWEEIGSVRGPGRCSRRQWSHTIRFLGRAMRPPGVPDLLRIGEHCWNLEMRPAQPFGFPHPDNAFHGQWCSRGKIPRGKSALRFEAATLPPRERRYSFSASSRGRRV